MDQSAPAVPSLSYLTASKGEYRSFLEAIGQLWMHGVDIDWMPLHEGRQPRRVPLPSYVFDRKRHWIEKRVSLFSAQPGTVTAKETTETEIENVDTGRLLRNCDRRDTEIDSTGRKDRIHEIEVRLIEMWRGYLGVENIRIEDNFFELGGDSLLAARLHSQIRREFKVELPLTGVFELATIRHVSLYIAINHDPDLIDALSEEDLDDVLAVMESWPAEARPDMPKHATTK
jgi:acyl carrier protein